MVVKGFPHLDLFGDIKDLQRFRAENIISGKLILATDVKDDGQKVIIKVLPKTCFNTRASKRSQLPMNVKFMTKLLRYYESDDELILVLEYIAPGPLFKIIHPYLKEQAKENFLAAKSSLETVQKVIKNVNVEIATESEIKSLSPDPGPDPDPDPDGNDEDDLDMEIVCTLGTETKEGIEDDKELICLSKSGIEKISCYDINQRERERFEMLQDHTNEVIKKLDTEQNYLSVNHGSRMMTPASFSSAPISVTSTAPVSPTMTIPTNVNLESYQLSDLMGSFGGLDLKTSQTLPIGLIRLWTVQLVKALSDLHSKSIYMMDLNPNNLLLNLNGELVLTYQYQWVSIDNPLDFRCIDKMYTAPEVLTSSKPSPEADWWSVGVILFEIVTGLPFYEIYPSGLLSHAPLNWYKNPQTDCIIEEEIELKDLISKLVIACPQHRLTTEEIRNHRFFRCINWNS